MKNKTKKWFAISLSLSDSVAKYSTYLSSNFTTSNLESMLISLSSGRSGLVPDLVYINLVLYFFPPEKSLENEKVG